MFNLSDAMMLSSMIISYHVVGKLHWYQITYQHHPLIQYQLIRTLAKFTLVHHQLRSITLLYFVSSFTHLMCPQGILQLQNLSSYRLHLVIAVDLHVYSKNGWLPTVIAYTMYTYHWISQLHLRPYPSYYGDHWLEI